LSAAKRSRISPPEPVAAPLKGSTVVGKLCVSAFKITESNSYLKIRFVCFFGANCCTRGPLQKPHYLYMPKQYRLGFPDVFLINLKKRSFFLRHQLQMFH
jgi:hypothetical protein